MNATCTSCQTVFRVDPVKVPAAGVRARCSVCSGIFWVRVTELVPAAAAPVAARPAPVSEPTPAEAAAAVDSTHHEALTSPFGESFDDWHARTTAPAAADAIEERRSREPEIPAPWPEFPPEPVAPVVPPVVESAPPAPVAAAPKAAEFPPVPPVVTSPSLAPPAVGGTPPATRPFESAAAVSDTALPPIAPPVTAPRTPIAPAVPGSIARAPAAAVPPLSTPFPAAAPAMPRPAAAAPAAGARKVRVNPFMSQDPSAKARRLARALISDMVVYHPAKRREGLQRNTLKSLFEEEIKKSWEEYVDQVGRELAESTPYFHEALNEILADGQTLFP